METIVTKPQKMKTQKKDIYLVDSGGQYNFGTTDVTRTISDNDNRIRNFYEVLKGHIAYQLQIKKYIGSLIDKAARKPLQEVKLVMVWNRWSRIFLNVRRSASNIEE